MQIESQVELRHMNTLRLSSTAEYFVRVQDEEQLRRALDWARKWGRPVTPIGDGSNIVLREFIPGLVMQIALRGIQLLSDDGQHIKLRVAAGENWHNFVSWNKKQGFHGMENLALIPGLVGSTPVQNIGAYGVEVAHFIDGVLAYQISTGEYVYMTAKDCCFAYRSSIFKCSEGKDLVITAVDFTVDRYTRPVVNYPLLVKELADSPVTPKRVFDAVIAIRKQRLPDPDLIPNVGSFFKNPLVNRHDAESMSIRWPELPQYTVDTENELARLSAAWMIDKLGWRGKLINGVKMSTKHALILVNESANSVGPVMALAQQIMDSVKQEYNIMLQIEPDVLG